MGVGRWLELVSSEGQGLVEILGTGAGRWLDRRAWICGRGECGVMRCSGKVVG